MNFLTQFFRGVAERLVPVRPVQVVEDSRWDPPPVAPLMDVDGIKSVLEEARNGDTRRLFQLYQDVVGSDNHLQAQLNTRKLAILGDQENIRPADPKNGADVVAAQRVEQLWKAVPERFEAVTHLLDAVLFPVSVLEKWFVPAEGELRAAGFRFEARLKAVPYHLLDYSLGRLRVRLTDGKTGMPVEAFMEVDRETPAEERERLGIPLDGPRRFVCHRGHLLTNVPDNRGGPMRSLLFWWLFKTLDREWWANFLERFGAPFIVGKYDSLDERAKGKLERAFSSALRLFGLVVSKETEVQLMQAVTQSNGEAFRSMIDTANREMSKLILGQTGSSEMQAAGLGSNQAQVHDNVRGDYKDFDSRATGVRIREDIFRQLMDLNGIAGAAPELTWGAEDSASVEETNASLAATAQAGLEPDDAGLEIIGRRLGWGLRRKTVPVGAGPGAGTPLAATPPQGGRAAAEALLRGAAVDLAAQFGDHAGAVRRALRESTSAADLERRLREGLGGLSAEDRAAVLAEALAGAAAAAL